jgi:hypothetical protein
VVRLEGGQPTAVFYLLGYPMAFASEEAILLFQHKWRTTMTGIAEMIRIDVGGWKGGAMYSLKFTWALHAVLFFDLWVGHP